MKNPHFDELDTPTGLPKKLGWTVAVWALGLLQLIIIALLTFLLRSSIEQGQHLANIEGRLGIKVAVLAKDL